MNAEELLRRLEADPLERLKWMVLCFFGVLPGSEAARGLRDEDYVICGAHMLIDAGRPSAVCADEACANLGFDESRYLELSEEPYEL